MANNQINHLIIQYLKFFNLHHQDYNLSDAQLKAQLFKKIGDNERTHLDFQLDSFTFEDVVNSLEEEFEGRFTVFVLQHGESLNAFKLKLKSCLVYLMSVGGAHYVLPLFILLEYIRSFLPNPYQNYMAQIVPNRISGLDAVGIIDVVFRHLAFYY